MRVVCKFKKRLLLPSPCQAASSRVSWGPGWDQACGALSGTLSGWGLGQTRLGSMRRRGQLQVGALTRGCSKNTKDGVWWVGRVPGAAEPCSGLLPTPCLPGLPAHQHWLRSTFCPRTPQTHQPAARLGCRPRLCSRCWWVQPSGRPGNTGGT